jgi:hypothetical protein
MRCDAGVAVAQVLRRAAAHPQVLHVPALHLLRADRPGGIAVSVRGPAPRPCESCPYRRDVPSGVWAEEEYLLLPRYDRGTAYQPHGIFLCHQNDGRMCAGWVGCHDMDDSVGLRIALSLGVISAETYQEALAYVSPVRLFKTGAAACRHGLRRIANPSKAARALVAKIIARRGDGTG